MAAIQPIANPTKPPSNPSQIPTTIGLRTPSKYTASATAVSPSPSLSAPPELPSPLSAFPVPTPGWLYRTWTVTHSTLKLWRSAQNVRISYRALPDNPKLPGRLHGARNEDRVDYESNKPSKTPPAVKTVEGVNHAAGDDGLAWDWRGKGWLRFVTSHWEILGWGERPLPGGGGGGDNNNESAVEGWVVTWFAPTLFTAEGIDLYSSRPEGLSPETVDAIRAAAADSWPPKLAALAAQLRPVDIKLPWQPS